MGKGDKKSKKGKRFMGSTGKTRLQKKKTNPVPVVETEKTKPKKAEQEKKATKTEA